MTARATFVMYHYVRDLPRTAFPRIKACLASDFEAQLDFMQRFYEFVRVEDVIAAIYDGAELPRNAALLTFDDGYADHYATVFPLLAKRGIQGAFFVPAQPITEHRVLRVNKIQFALAAADEAVLFAEVLAALDELRADHALPSNEELFAKYRRPNRFDTADVVFIKHLLQKGLPRELRNAIADRLFARHVSADEQGFAQELYVSTAQLREMVAAGMVVGSHGDTHEWLGEQSVEDQSREIDRSLAFLQDLGVDADNWTIAYPYGSYNDALLELLVARRCKLGFSGRIDIGALTRDNALTLERLDTNDLPKQASAAPGLWTERALAS